MTSCADCPDPAAKGHTRCHKCRMRKYRAEHPDEIDATHRSRRLKYLYGMSEQDYSARFIAQGGVCAICGAVPGPNLVVDHCHLTGKVRGLLCGHCNKGLGQFRDDPNVLDKAIDYLQNTK